MERDIRARQNDTRWEGLAVVYGCTHPRRVRDGGLRTLGSVGRQERDIVQLLNGTLSCTVSGAYQGQEAIAIYHLKYNETAVGAG